MQFAPSSFDVPNLEISSILTDPETIQNPHVDAPYSSTLENDEISIILMADEVLENSSTDSVFTSSSPIGATPTPVTQENAIDQEKSIQGRQMGRFALYSDGGIAVCRICHSSEISCPFSNGEPLISPCDCRGSTGLYHRTCLERWLSSSNKEKCEICKFPYYLEKQPKGLLEFLVNPGSKTIRRHVISDLICWLILTPTTAIGAWLCIAGAIIRASSQDSDKIQVPTLAGLAFFLLTTYLVWSTICFRYHAKVWRRWRKRNYRIRLLDAEEAQKKRRIPSPNSANKNNAGFQIRPLRTPDPNMNNVQVQISSHRSTTSDSTNYSTPWLRFERIRQSRIHSTPIVHSNRDPGPSTIFEPRPPMPLFEDVAL